MKTHKSSHHMLLQQGFLMAYPVVADKVLTMHIEAWDHIARRPMDLDSLALPETGEWVNEFEVPFYVLNGPFRFDDVKGDNGKVFEGGRMFSLSSGWNYPFYGARIGAFAKPFPALELPRGATP